ncbi:hypothetical protein ACWGE0_26860 [Lentzea sp. NPDC054927]
MYQKFLEHHSDVSFRSAQTDWRVTHWNDHTVVRSNGDAVINLQIRVRAAAQGARYFQIVLGSGRDDLEWQEMRYVRAAVEVRGGDSRWYSTTRWLPNDKLQIGIHCFAAHLQMGEELRLCYTVSWPGRDQVLMSGEPDAFTYYWNYPVPYLRYLVELPEGSRVHPELVSLNPVDDNYSFSIKKSAVELIVHEIAARRRVGMRLQLLQAL